MPENIQQQNAANAAQQAANAAANAAQNANAQPQTAPQQKQESSSHLGWYVAGGVVLLVGATAVISYRKGKAAGREEERFRREADADAVAGAISAGLNAGERYSSSDRNTESRGVNANRR
jgi:hypothetical protein